MTKTTVPFEASEIKNNYFEIVDIRNYKANNRFAHVKKYNLNRYSKTADLSVKTKFGKQTFEYTYSVYFNDIEEVIEDLRNLYRGKQLLKDSTTAVYMFTE